MESSRYRKASEAFDACNSEIKELEEAAGITSRELGTFRNHKERVRAQYFAITHSYALRQKLISKNRESHRLFIALQEAILDDLKDKLKKTKYREDRFWLRDDFWWLFFASLVGIWLVSWGSVFHTEGAIAGAVVALFVGRYLEERAKLRHALAVEEAEQEVQGQQSFITSMSEPRHEDFNFAEEATGTEDRR